jgi:hypothetical protein
VPGASGGKSPCRPGFDILGATFVPLQQFFFFFTKRPKSSMFPHPPSGGQQQGEMSKDCRFWLIFEQRLPENRHLGSGVGMTLPGRAKYI